MAGAGLLALLDDIALIADDVATLTAKAAGKTTGIVTDDMAVTAEQAIGIQREREIPVILAVARGSFFNKAVILAPSALILNAVAPWAITPLLMAGGAFLCFEGVEKVLHKVLHAEETAKGPEADLAITDPVAFEASRVKGAIRTDLILSAEIIAISLGEVTNEPLVTQVGVLYGISVLMTVGVYGLVAALIKLDDLGEALVLRGGSSIGLGKAIIWGTPYLLRAIGVIGTVAMMIVGGHIVRAGIPPVYDAVHHLVEGLPGAVQGVAGIGVDILSGMLVGLALVGVAKTGLIQGVWARLKGLRTAA